MAEKIPKCKGGGRHKWTFKRNFTRSTTGHSSASFSAVGWYRCDVCSAGKTGPFQHVEPAKQESE